MTGRMRRSWRLVVAALAFASGLLIAAAPAWAGGLRDFSVVQTTSPMSSSTAKSLTSACPAGKNSLGGAAFVSPGLGNLGLFSVGASATTSVGGASETDGESASWRLFGRAFCVTFTAAPPPAGGAAHYVKAVQIARHHSANNSLPAKSVIASCPAGKTAISGGGRIAPPNLDVALTAMQRVGANRWRVAAHEVDPTSAAWTLNASVVCANLTSETHTADYAAGYASPGSASALSSMPLQSVAPSCSPGWHVVGGGAQVEGATPGSAPPPDVVITSSEAAGSSGSAIAWIAIAHESDPTSRSWRIVGTAICTLNGGPPA